MNFQSVFGTLRGLSVCVLLLIALGGNRDVAGFEDVEHKHAENDGVRIHYAATGTGPLVVFVHGFPDCWITWRHQMEGLKDGFRVVAMDCRGYNLSGQPERQEDYDMSLLVEDVAAVIKAEGADKATIVGHDWGGAIAWHFVATHPELSENLIIVNLPHPKGMARELANNPEQQENSQYARDFQKPDSHKLLNARGLASFLAKDEATREEYVEAFERSSFNGMMNYYRQNYPTQDGEQAFSDIPDIEVPVLQFHGLEDEYLLHQGLNQTWDWIEKDYTLVTLPNIGHWAHRDAAEMVTNTMKAWLELRR